MSLGKVIMSLCQVKNVSWLSQNVSWPSQNLELDLEESEILFYHKSLRYSLIQIITLPKGSIYFTIFALFTWNPEKVYLPLEECKASSQSTHLHHILILLWVVPTSPLLATCASSQAIECLAWPKKMLKDLKYLKFSPSPPRGTNSRKLNYIIL